MRLGKLNVRKGHVAIASVWDKDQVRERVRRQVKGIRGNARVRVRDGVTVSALLECTCLFSHMPKIGFSNHNFRVVYQTVNIADIESRGLEGEVGVDALLAAGLVRSDKQPIKILGDGELSRSVTIKAQHFSKSARKNRKSRRSSRV